MAKEDLKELSRRMLDYRAKHNLSQIKFAKLCNLTHQTICYIENCAQEPTRLTVRKILNVIEKED